jgi:nucleoside-diphosphate-sugar epimerase
VGGEVCVLDLFLYGEESLEELKTHPNCELFCGDVRDITAVVKSMQGCDAVIRLAAIVGD